MATLRQRVVLPPSTRQFGGLLAAARDLTSAEGASQWWRGVTFTGGGCVAPISRDGCVDVGAQTDLASRPAGDASVFSPLIVRQGAECSSLQGDRAAQADLAARRLDATREWAVARELQTGAETGNPSLNDAAELAGSPFLLIQDALACLEQHAADELYGAPAFIHASPLVGTHLLAARVIWREGRAWRTASGNVVVVSPGYQGTDLYATTEVFAATGQRSTLVDTDRRENTDVAWADELALAVFDPCWVGRVATDLTDCTLLT